MYKKIFTLLTSMVLIISCGSNNKEEVERVTLDTFTEVNNLKSATTEKSYEYVSKDELQNFPLLQLEFVRDVVKASRNPDQGLGLKRLHSSVLAHSRCSALLIKTLSGPPIGDQYAVRVKPGEKPNSLYFSIKHQNQSNQPDFFQMKNVVIENGRLVINTNCDALLTMLDQMQNYKEWENDHECGYKIEYNNNTAIKSSSGVSSDKPVEGADLYEYCLRVCDALFFTSCP